MSSLSRPVDQRADQQRRVLWWGRSDPAYARNAVLRRCLVEAGYQLVDFRPTVSALGDVEAALRIRIRPDLVWVPSFRQRDVSAASRFCQRRGVPLVFDPLISAYDKQVEERGKFSASSDAARRLLDWERRLFCAADLLLADTGAHAEYFCRVHGVSEQRIHVVPMSAEEALFRPASLEPPRHGSLEALFYGSFLPLQAPEIIVEAANLYRGPAVAWRLLGAGPGLGACRARLRPGVALEFEDWLDYAKLPDRIARVHMVLGIFGDTAKAARVVPNKVCQALACGRPLITRASPALPKELGAEADSGVTLVPPANPQALAEAVAELAASPDRLGRLGRRARDTYQRYFSTARVTAALSAALDRLGLTRPGG